MLSVGLRVSPGSTAELFGALPSCVGSRAGKTSKTHVESECIEPDKNIRWEFSGQTHGICGKWM